MTKKAYRFVKANRKSPVVYGSVLTKARRLDRTDALPEPHGVFYRLADGTTWKLLRADLASIVGAPRWAHEALA